MNLSCSSRTIKYLMFAFNLFFVISGIIIIAVGATVKTVYSEYSYFLDTKYFTLPNMLIATGVFIFFISFFGCCGAIRESWIMLGVFSIFLCIIFIFEFSAGIAGYALRGKTINYLDATLKANLKNYPHSSHFIWDSIQTGFKCCGVDNYTDWKETFSDQYALPISCCPITSGSAGEFYCNSYIKPVTSEGTTPSTTKTTTTVPTTPTTAEATTDTDETTTPTPAPTTTSEPSPKNVIRRKRAVNDTLLVEETTTISTPSAASTSPPYTIGCKSAFGQYIKKHAVQIGGCALGLAIVQILGIVFSCHLVRQMKNGYYST